MTLGQCQKVVVVFNKMLSKFVDFIATFYFETNQNVSLLCFVGHGYFIINSSFHLPGNDPNSFALQIFENTSLWCENSYNRLQIKQKAKDIKGSNVAVLLDLENQIMNIYWNGKLQTDDSRPGGPSMVGMVGPIRPAFSMFGGCVQLSLQTGLERPTTCPGKRWVRHKKACDCD